MVLPTSRHPYLKFPLKLAEPQKLVWCVFQLLDATRNRKLVEILFFKEMFENNQKRYFGQLSGVRSTQKLVKIHNTCSKILKNLLQTGLVVECS